MAQEQEVKKVTRRKVEFNKDMVFGLGAQFELGDISGPQAEKSLEELANEPAKAAREKNLNEAARRYSAAKGEGGDRSRVYGIL